LIPFGLINQGEEWKLLNHIILKYQPPCQGTVYPPFKKLLGLLAIGLPCSRCRFLPEEFRTFLARTAPDSPQVMDIPKLAVRCQNA